MHAQWEIVAEPSLAWLLYHQADKPSPYIISARRMRTRVTVVCLSVCVCVSTSVYVFVIALVPAYDVCATN